MGILFARQRLLQSFSWRGIGVFFAAIAALSAWTWSGVLFTPKVISFEEHAEYLLSLFQRNLLSYFPVYVTVAIADSFPLQGMHRRALLLGALVLGVLLAVQMRCAVMPNQLFYVYSSTQIPYCSAFPTWRTYFDFPNTWITPLTIAGMVMVFVFSRRRAAELAASLQAVASAQIESRRQRIESEIEAMHSRVDPDGLLETMRLIRARYEHDVNEGEAMMEKLILGLREAAGRPMPAGAE